MADKTPQRFTGRVGVHGNGRVRRALNAVSDTRQRFDESVDVGKDGRLGVKLSRSSGLKMTREGLALDPLALGDKNRDSMSLIKDPSSVTVADVHSTLVELLAELRRTKRMR